MQIEKLRRKIAFLGTRLVDQMLDNPMILQIKSGETILKNGSYITHIPIVLTGVVKVFTRQEDKDLLLYYIESDESCIMSFSSSINNQMSSVYAITESDCEVLMLPVEKVRKWTKEYPQLNLFFFNMYNVRYKDLLNTINQLVFDKLDKRVIDYLSKKVALNGDPLLSITHRQIAEELGTVREVISRILKKLEKENLITITKTGLRINNLTY